VSFPSDRGTAELETALLVIVGVFPVVMHEIRFLRPLLTWLGFLAALTTFTVHCLTAAATTFILMPPLIRWFGWWLFVEQKKAAWAEPAGSFSGGGTLCH
jgi:antibiotic biosynthesis monooxygenase (ABM) superfamily enzyme